MRALIEVKFDARYHPVHNICGRFCTNGIFSPTGRSGGLGVRTPAKLSKHEEHLRSIRLLLIPRGCLADPIGFVDPLPIAEMQNPAPCRI